jgi:hypothetical protein
MAAKENRRWAEAARCFHQTTKCIAAIVRHADAIMDQTIVTQLICGEG